MSDDLDNTNVERLKKGKELFNKRCDFVSGILEI